MKKYIVSAQWDISHHQLTIKSENEQAAIQQMKDYLAEFYNAVDQFEITVTPA